MKIVRQYRPDAAAHKRALILLLQEVIRQGIDGDGDLGQIRGGPPNRERENAETAEGHNPAKR
jgi:hypothetical protein